jgi:hypothetical protein
MKEHKWLDVKVDDWPVNEIFHDKFLQKDGYVEIMVSYMLNFVSLQLLSNVYINLCSYCMQFFMRIILNKFYGILDWH